MEIIYIILLNKMIFEYTTPKNVNKITKWLEKCMIFLEKKYKMYLPVLTQRYSSSKIKTIFFLKFILQDNFYFTRNYNNFGTKNITNLK